jgi:hypothetical protein
METSVRLLHWIPRVMCILAILLISLFAADAFAPGQTILQQFGAYFIHLIPSFILVILLIIAWKREFIGGIIFTVLGLGLSPAVFMVNYRHNHSIWMCLGIIAAITVPFVIVGILFMVSHKMKKRIR